MSLPNLSALTFTGAPEERSQKGAIQTLREDSVYVWARVMQKMIGSYTKATFYHSAFCGDVTSLKGAFELEDGKKIEGGPTEDAYEALYGLLIQDGRLLPDPWVKQRGYILKSDGSRHITEAASTFFTRVCNEAGALRTRVLEFLTTFQQTPSDLTSDEDRLEYQLGRFLEMADAFTPPNVMAWINDKPFVMNLLRAIEVERHRIATNEDPNRRYFYQTSPSGGIGGGIASFLVWSQMSENVLANIQNGVIDNATVNRIVMARTKVQRAYESAMDEQLFWELYNDDENVLSSTSIFIDGFAKVSRRLQYDRAFILKLARQSENIMQVAWLVQSLHSIQTDHPFLNDAEIMRRFISASPYMTADDFEKISLELRSNKDFVKYALNPTYDGLLVIPDLYEFIFHRILSYWKFIPDTLKADDDILELALTSYESIYSGTRSDPSFVNSVLSMMQDENECKPFDLGKDVLFKFVSRVYLSSFVKDDLELAYKGLCMCRDAQFFAMLPESVRGDTGILRFILDEIPFKTEEERKEFLKEAYKNIPDIESDEPMREDLDRLKMGFFLETI